MLNNEVRETIQVFNGQKSAVPFGVLNASDAEKIVNFYCRKGALRKVWGASKYAEPVLNGSGGVIWLDHFDYRWMFQQGTLIAIEDSEGSGTFSAITNSHTAERINSERWRNRIFMVNGVRNKFFETGLNGEKFLTLGVVPPGLGYRGNTGSSQPNLSVSQSNSSGALVDGTVYQYLITWYDALRGIESLPNGATVDEDGLWAGSNPAEITVASPSDTVTIDITNLKNFGYDTDRVTNWFAYRALVTSGVVGDFKRISTCPDEGFPIGTTSTTDGDPDEADLGQLLDTTISPPPSGSAYEEGDQETTYGPKFVKEFRDSLFMFGAEFPGSGALEYEPVDSLAYASVAQNFDHWKYTYDIGRANGQKATGMEKFRNTLCFFKEASIYALDGTNHDNYNVRELDAERGCVAPGSVHRTPKGIIALSAEGFILVDGTGPSDPISEEIFDEVQKINLSASEKIRSGFNHQEGKYECHVPLSPSTVNNAVFYYDVNFKTWTIKRIGFGQSVKYSKNSSGRAVGLLGDPANSRLFDVCDEDQVTFNGQKIHSQWRSKNFDFGHPSKNKRLSFIKIKAKGKTDFKISVEVILDFGQGGVIDLGEFTSQSVFSTWAEDEDDSDGMVWDQGLWSGEFTDKKFEILASGVARNIQIVIREKETSENRGGFQIDEIILEGTLYER